MAARSARSQAPVILNEILLSIIGMFHGLHDLSIQQSTALKSFVSGSDTFLSLPTGRGKSFIYQLAILLMKELSKRSGDLSFHVPSHPMILVASARLLGILGLGSELYSCNMQRMLNKDITRFMQSLSRERQNRASKRKAQLAEQAVCTSPFCDLWFRTRC